MFFAQRSHKHRIKNYFYKEKDSFITCSKSRDKYMSTDLTNS